ncbi:HNH endonuclease [Methylobacterium oryzisoli]|uniref:HNH endonuclease n=1 Tax=Methylobacterium oryzisoli TaxID=3385502 RepID=UPI00389201CF
MRRKPPFSRCERRTLPGRLRADIMLRQDGRCADCGSRLIIGFFVFDHRPPLALRSADDDANDPDRLAAICWACDQRKTRQDLREIARAKRLAEAHEDHLMRMRDKVAGRRAPTRKEWEAFERVLRRQSEFSRADKDPETLSEDAPNNQQR